MPEVVDVVVVNWNSGVQLADCIRSLEANALQNIGKIIIVDNGSTDSSAEGFELSDKVKVIRAGVNLGFGKACNLGASSCTSDFILFLNPDAFVYKDTIHSALSFMCHPDNQKIGVCGVQLRDENDHVARSCTRLPTANGLLVHAVGLDRFFPKLGHFMSEWDHSESRLVDHVIGAFYLIRRSLFEDLCGFDERFFVYLEDLDLSNRIKARGWNIQYLANVRAFHKGGGTSDKVKAKRLFYSLRSRVIYAFKHFSRVDAVLVLFATLLVEPFCRIAKALLSRSFSAVSETLTAYGYLSIWLMKRLFTKS